MNYGMYMARKRSQARQQRMEQKSKPSTEKKVVEVKLHLDPLSGHDGSVLEHPIVWGQNDDISDTMLEYLDRPDRTVFLDLGTGLGKTALSVETWGKKQLRDSRQIPALIVAPRSVIDKKGWMKTIQQYNNNHPDNQLHVVAIETPSRIRMIKNYAPARRQLIKALGKDGIVIIDEVHNFKTPTSQQSKAMHIFRHLPQIGVSATLFTNDRIMDSIGYLTLSGKYNSKNKFLEENEIIKYSDKMTGALDLYESDGRISKWKFKDYEEFLNEMRDIVYSPDVSNLDIDMPHVNASLKQLAFDEDLASKIRSISYAHRQGAFESKTDMFLSVIETLYTSESRMDYMMSILKNPKTVRPIVFYWHEEVRKALEERLQKEGMQYQIVSGSHRASDADFELDIPLLVQYQAGSEGIEMPNSNTTIFYQNQNSYRHLMQSRGRNVRRGRTHEVFHYSIVDHTSFDRELFESVENMGELNVEFVMDMAETMIKE